MIKSYFRTMVWALLLCIFIFCFVGCGWTNANKVNNNAAVPRDIEFPLAETQTIKYWVPLGGSVGVVQSFNEMGVYKEAEKRTNVKVEFIHPVEGQIQEQFNVMIASRDYPDIIEGLASYYIGGAEKALEDGVIISLNDMMQKFAPNLTAIYEMYPFIKPYVLNEDGYYLTMPMLRGGAILRQSEGPIFRKDWLEELNLPIPETIDDWTNTLKAFKEKKGIRAPLIMATNELKRSCIAGAFGITTGFFADDGKIKYGPYDDRYKDYLQVLRLWYSEGYLDPEFGNLTAKVKDSRILNGEAGAYIGAMGNGLQRYITLKEGKDEKFALQPVPYPVKEKGQVQEMTSLMGTVTSTSASITAGSKIPEIALAWLDYFYGKEGHLLMNFGIEGESYEMINGEPVFTELLTRNPDGTPFSSVGRRYARSFGAGPMVQDTKYGNQFFALPVQKEAVQLWGKYSKEASEAGHDALGRLTSEENIKVTPKMNQITTFVDEHFVKFVMGSISLNEFDAYKENLRKMGIEDVIAINQKAHDRFIAKYPDYKIPYDFDVSEYFWK